MLKIVYLLFALSFVPITLPSCGGGLAAVLPSVVTVVQEAIVIINGIADFVTSLNLPASVKADIDAVVQICRETVDVIQSLADAGKDFDDKDMKAAIENFRLAFNKLLAMLDKYGVVAQGKYATQAGIAIKYLVPIPKLLQ
jgi:hypothetical protein